MDNNEILDPFKASGSVEIKFSARMFEHNEIKQENFDGWDCPEVYPCQTMITENQGKTEHRTLLLINIFLPIIVIEDP